MRDEMIDLEEAADLLTDETGRPGLPTLRWIVDRHSLKVWRVPSKGRYNYKLLVLKSEILALKERGWRLRRPRRRSVPQEA